MLIVTRTILLGYLHCYPQRSTGLPRGPIYPAPVFSNFFALNYHCNLGCVSLITPPLGCENQFVKKSLAHPWTMDNQVIEFPLAYEKLRIEFVLSDLLGVC